MKIIYRSRIDWITKSTILLMLVVSIGMPIGIMYDVENKSPYAPFFVLLLMLLLSGVMILFFLKTDYTFTESALKCRSWIFKKELPYASIRKIERGTSFYAGWKLASAQKGLVLHYNKFDDLYISPEKEEEFIKQLTEINPLIEIKVQKTKR